MELAARVRTLLAARRGVSERAMFGGLAFLVGGNLAVAANRLGGIMVRVDPGDGDRLERTTKASVAVMRGRRMPGWLVLDAEDVRTKRQLEPWVARGADYAASLPRKPGARR